LYSNNIRSYFTIGDIAKGLIIAFSMSLFIYLSHINIELKLLNTALGIFGLFLLIGSSNRAWFWSGFFTSLAWFWWILLSFRFYGMAWAMPIGTFLVAISFGLIFLLLAWISSYISRKTKIPLALLHALSLWSMSFIHPFGFDWFKPELIFVESYIGITKWQFAIVLISITIAHITQKLRYLWLLVFAFSYQETNIPNPIPSNMQIVTTSITMDTKWQQDHQKEVFKMIFDKIDNAIENDKKIIVFPESIFPLFLNLEPELLKALQEKSQNIDMVIGGLYWDKNIPRNSTYIFHQNQISVANKVVLVPFGEQNPLPAWLGKLVNKIFYKEGVLDYVASNKIADYKLGYTTYRNAICYEATSEKLYEGEPKHMIVLSNNGWFMPSIEPTLQRLLLQYYSFKYDTTIYHSINMSPSYVIKDGKTFYTQP
jgi:apolipoprotein N-acyltransferase